VRLYKTPALASVGGRGDGGGGSQCLLINVCKKRSFAGNGNGITGDAVMHVGLESGSVTWFIC